MNFPEKCSPQISKNCTKLADGYYYWSRLNNGICQACFDFYKNNVKSWQNTHLILYDSEEHYNNIKNEETSQNVRKKCIF